MATTEKDEYDIPIDDTFMTDCFWDAVNSIEDQHDKKKEAAKSKSQSNSNSNSRSNHNGNGHLNSSAPIQPTRRNSGPKPNRSTLSNNANSMNKPKPKPSTRSVRPRINSNGSSSSSGSNSSQSSQSRRNKKFKMPRVVNKDTAVARDVLAHKNKSSQRSQHQQPPNTNNYVPKSSKNASKNKRNNNPRPRTALDLQLSQSTVQTVPIPSRSQNKSSMDIEMSSYSQSNHNGHSHNDSNSHYNANSNTNSHSNSNHNHNNNQHKNGNGNQNGNTSKQKSILKKTSPKYNMRDSVSQNKPKYADPEPMHIEQHENTNNGSTLKSKSHQKSQKPPLQRQSQKNKDALSYYGDTKNNTNTNNATNTTNNSYSPYSNGTYKNDNLSASCSANSISHYNPTSQASITSNSNTNTNTKHSQNKSISKQNNRTSRNGNHNKVQSSSSSEENERDAQGFAIPNRSLLTPRSKRRNSKKPKTPKEDPKIKDLTVKLVKAKHETAILRKQKRTQEKEYEAQLELAKRQAKDARLTAARASTELQQLRNQNDDQYQKQYKTLQEQIKEMKHQRDAKELELANAASRYKQCDNRRRSTADKMNMMKREYTKLYKVHEQEKTQREQLEERNKQLTQQINELKASQASMISQQSMASIARTNSDSNLNGIIQPQSTPNHNHNHNGNGSQSHSVPLQNKLSRKRKLDETQNGTGNDTDLENVCCVNLVLVNLMECNICFVYVSAQKEIESKQW